MSKETADQRPQRYNHDEDLKVPSKEGHAPRPATEPQGAERSSRTGKTEADPVTGAPQRPAKR